MMKRNSLLFIVLVTAALLVIGSVPVSADYVIGKWTFNEGTGPVANDSSGYDLKATLSSGSMWSTHSVSGAGLYLDGANSASVSGSSPYMYLLNFAANQSFTIEAWVYVPANMNRWQAVISSGRSFGSSVWYGIWISSDNRWVFGAAGGNIYGDYVTTGVWHHIAAVQYGGGLTRNLYIDGALAATGPSANGITNLPLIFGAAGIGENFTGYLDEVTIRDYSLDCATIYRDYQKYAPTRLAYWRCEEPPTVTTIADSSGNGFTGYPVSGGAFHGMTSYMGGGYCIYCHRGGCLYIPANSRFDFSRYDNFTITAWVNLNHDVFNNQWNCVLSKGRGTSQWYGLWISPDKRWVFGSQSGNIIGNPVTSGWHLIKLVQSGATHTRNLYVDGVPQGSGSSADALTSDYIVIGAYLNSGGSYYENYAGWLDEISIYNYVAP